MYVDGHDTVLFSSVMKSSACKSFCCLLATIIHIYTTKRIAIVVGLNVCIAVRLSSMPSSILGNLNEMGASSKCL